MRNSDQAPGEDPPDQVHRITLARHSLLELPETKLQPPGRGCCRGCCVVLINVDS